MCEACTDPSHVGGRGSLDLWTAEICSGFSVRRVLVASLPLYRRIVSRSLRDPQDVDDVLQSFAVKALERASQLREPLAAHGWLWRLLHTTLLDHFRHHGRRRAREIPLDPQRHDVAEEPALSFDPGLNRIVTCSLAKLKPEYRKILLEVDLQERPTTAVAAELDITLNNLAVRLHRARRSARQHVERMLV